MAVTSAICSERVAKVDVQDRSATCVLANQTKLFLSRALAKAVAVGDAITFPIPESDAVGPEILVAKKFVAGRIRYLYQAPIGYVGQPKQDNRGQHFVSPRFSRENLASDRSSCLAKPSGSTSTAFQAQSTPSRTPLSTKCCIFQPPQLLPNFAWHLSCETWNSSLQARPTRNEWR